MKKILFYFIICLLLSQCLSEDDKIACTTENNDTPCKERSTTSKIYTCEATGEEETNPITCTQKKIACSGATEFDELDKCGELSTDNIVCYAGENGCLEADDCEDVTSHATEAICSKFLIDDPKNKCVFISANAQNSGNVEAHCEISPKQCTESLGNVEGDKEAICSARDVAENKICYFNGNSCAEASKCEDIVLSGDITVQQATCDKYNTKADAQSKCMADNKKCILKSYCEYGTSEHECSYYAVKDSNKICVPKEDAKTGCEEMTSEDYQARIAKAASELCGEKTGNQCALTFSNNYFILCQIEGEKCTLKETYGTCDSAKALSSATNEQCSKLKHSSDKYCIKGENGCLEVDTCENISAKELTDALCKNFPAPSNYECVKGDGNKCKLAEKKTGGNSSSQALTLSFVILILILVI